MSVSRRAVASVLALAAVAALVGAFLLLGSRGISGPDGVNDSADASSQVDGAPDRQPRPPTSEELIAAALAAGDLTYEESLLARAYGLFDDPRLAPAFRSPIVDWEAGTALFIEVENREATLSQRLLADLAPFRVRPNDPISIFNRPRAEVVRAQLSLHGDWESRPVPGTNIRLWNKGPLPRRTEYEGMIGRVWRVFDRFFPHPMPDDGTPASTINPDGAIDIYLVDGQAIDPRTAMCQPPIAPDDLDDCTLRTDRGAAHAAPSSTQGGASGYAIVNRGLSDEDMIDIIAHELAHVTQVGYDLDETRWLVESTATWVAYRVMKQLGLEPTWEYGWLKYTNKPSDLAEFFSNLHLKLDYVPKMYSSWIFFYYASMELGDGIVKRVWEAAGQTPGRDGIRAVNEVIPLDRHFPEFALRNWNQDTVPRKYETKDDTFKPDITPLWVNERPFASPRTYEIGQAIVPLATWYHRFTFDDVIRKVTFESLRLSLAPGTPRPYVWAIKKIQQDWRTPRTGPTTSSEPSAGTCRPRRSPSSFSLSATATSTGPCPRSRSCA